MEKYKANFDDDVRMLEKYGGIDPQNGDYLPHFCRGCEGPLLGHIEEERDCQGPKISNDDRQILLNRIFENEHYDVQLKFLDKRQSEIHCRPCNLIFHNASSITAFSLPPTIYVTLLFFPKPTST